MSSAPMTERRRALVAGAGGQLGRRMTAVLQQNGWRVRALCRDPARLAAAGVTADEVHVADALDRAALHGACHGVDLLFSSLGASVAMARVKPDLSFEAVDRDGNLQL